MKVKVGVFLLLLNQLRYVLQPIFKKCALGCSEARCIFVFLSFFMQENS